MNLSLQDYSVKRMEQRTKSFSNNIADVIVIDDDPVPSRPITKPKEPQKSDVKSCKLKRMVNVDQSRDTETLIVTQNVHVKKQKIQCIINLTNICEKPEKKRKCHRKREGKRKHPSAKVRVKECREDRIVPHCLRKKCKSAVDSKCCRRRHQKKQAKQRKEKSINITNEPKSICTPQYLSPVSSILLDDDDATLENISSDSFTISSCNELDTLNKRAKDRERKLSFSDTKWPLSASTPMPVQKAAFDDGTIFSGDMDISIQSHATLVLEPQTNTHSPTATLPRDPNTVYSPKGHEDLNTCSTNKLTNLEIIYLPTYPTDSPKDLTKTENTIPDCTKYVVNQDLPHSPVNHKFLNKKEQISSENVCDSENKPLYSDNEAYSPTSSPTYVYHSETHLANILSPEKNKQYCSDSDRSFSSIISPIKTIHLDTTCPSYFNYSNKMILRNFEITPVSAVYTDNAFLEDNKPYSPTLSPDNLNSV